ncbi:uncharacterized protein [Manis javanica]|uniref:uncharacterized protein isoform X2 n=1 Tax=Manis javanica TaxID=9974 RepID=UPI00187A10EC|nr:uncharacterized protein LOC108405055 isoform X2 [Manis javanica]
MELSAQYLREKLQWDLEAEHVELPSPCSVIQVRGEAAASETLAGGEHVPSGRTPAHPCL